MSGKQWVVLSVAGVLLVVVAVCFPVFTPMSPRRYGVDLAEVVLMACILAAAGLGVWVVRMRAGYASVMGCSVLVAVVAVAAGVLVVGNSDHGPSRQSPCISNLQKLAAGALAYAGDYDDRLPRASEWPAAIYPYLKNYRAYKCPNDERKEGIPFTAPGWSRKGWISYGANLRLSGAKTDDIAEPDRSILLFDCDLLAGAPDAAAWRHNDGANFAFVDGHVKWLKPRDVGGGR